MLPFAVAPGNGWILNAGAYVVGTENCVVTSRWAGCGAWICGGEGMFLTKVITNGDVCGMFFAGGYGSLERHDVPQGKQLYVDTGLFFAAHESAQIDVGLPGGCYELCFSGEGTVMKFLGPAVIYTQSRDPKIFRRKFQLPEGTEEAAEAGAQAAAS